MINAPSLVTRSKAGWFFGAAGAGLLAAQTLLPAYPSDVPSQVSVAAAHRGAELASVVAFLVSGALLVLGVVATNGVQLSRGRVLARVGLIVTGVGALWPVAGRASFTAMLAALAGNPDRSAAVTAVHAISNSGAFAVFLPLLAAFAVGPVVLMLGLRRAGALSVWPAALWLGGVFVVNAAENQSRTVAALGMALVAGALAWMGRAVASWDSSTSRFEAMSKDSVNLRRTRTGPLSTGEPAYAYDPHTPRSSQP